MTQYKTVGGTTYKKTGGSRSWKPVSSKPSSSNSKSSSGGGSSSYRGPSPAQIAAGTLEHDLNSSRQANKDSARFAALTQSGIRSGMSPEMAAFNTTKIVHGPSSSQVKAVQFGLSPHLHSSVNPSIHSRPSSDLNAKLTPLSETVQNARDIYKPEYTPEEQIVMSQSVGGGSETLMYRPDLRAQIFQNIDEKKQLESISAMDLGRHEPTAQKYEEGLANILEPLTNNSIGPVRAVGGLVEPIAYIPTAVPRTMVGLVRNPTATVGGMVQGLAETLVTDPWRGGGQLGGVVLGPRIIAKGAKTVPRGVQSAELKLQVLKNERTLINMAKKKDPFKQPGPVTEAVHALRFDAEVIRLRSNSKINDVFFDLQVTRLKGQKHIKNSINDLIASDKAQAQISQPVIKVQQFLKPAAREVKTSRSIKQSLDQDVFPSLKTQLAGKSKIFTTQEQLAKGLSQMRINQPSQVGIAPFVGLQSSPMFDQYRGMDLESIQESTVVQMLSTRVLQTPEQMQSPVQDQIQHPLQTHKVLPGNIGTVPDAMIEMPDIKIKGVPQIAPQSKKRRSKLPPSPLDLLDANRYNKYNDPLKIGASINTDVQKLLRRGL